MSNKSNFKQTDIGLIPDDWKLIQLSDLTKIISGGTPSRKIPEYYLGNNLWVKSGELEDNLISDTEEKVTNTAIKNSSAKLFPKDTVLIAMYGATVGKTAILAREATTNQAICAILPNYDIFIPDYLRFYIMTIRDKFLSQRYGGAQPNISQTIIKNTVIPLPQLPEQKKIAHILSKIQQAIETQAKIIKTTQELKKALMQKLFTEGLNGELQKQTEIGLIPGSWEVVLISTLGDTITGTTPRTALNKYYSPKEIDFIAPADIGSTKYIYDSTKKISKEGLNVSRPLSKGSVLCVCIGSSIGKIGLTYKDVSTTNQQINSIICNESFNPEFIYYTLQYYTNYWRTFASPNPVPILSKGKFEQIEIPVTKDLDVQLEIVKALSSLDCKIGNSLNSKNILKDLFQTTLNKLMTGQIRVKDIEFEMEEMEYS